MATVIKAGNNSTGAQVSSDNTGILTIATGTGAGTTAMTLDASQNMGVGTTSPTQRIDVIGGVRVFGAATLGAAQPAGLISYEAPNLRCYVGDGTGYSWRFSQRVSSTTTDLVTITDSGNVGIGTTTPTAKLDVTNGRIVGNFGSASFYPNANDEFASASRAGNIFSGFTGGWRNAGVINFETGTSAATRSTTGLLLLSTYGSNAYASAGINVNCNTGNGTIEFFTGGGTVAPTQKMALTNAGRVGIGTTTPNQPLDVNGSIAYSVSTPDGKGLNPLNTYSYNNNTANTIGSVNTGFMLIGISQGNGVTIIPVFSNAGGGVAWSFNAFDPDAGTFVNGAGPTINFATAGTSANSYQIVFSGSQGTATIQRTAGSASYTVTTYAVAG